MATKFDVDEKLLRKLADILSETGLSEIEYEQGEQRIRIARQLQVAAPVAAPAPTVAAPAQPQAGTGLALKPSEPPPGTVKSPMVGTVYTAPEPGKPPFIKVGDQVKEGQTLLIIEAMKVMNALPSPRAGRVAQILVADGQPVEFGEPLLVIE